MSGPHALFSSTNTVGLSIQSSKSTTHLNKSGLKLRSLGIHSTCVFTKDQTDSEKIFRATTCRWTFLLPTYKIHTTSGYLKTNVPIYLTTPWILFPKHEVLLSVPATWNFGLLFHLSACHAPHEGHAQLHIPCNQCHLHCCKSPSLLSESAKLAVSCTLLGFVPPKKSRFTLLGISLTDHTMPASFP